MDLSLADMALGGFEQEECLRHASACVEASQRYGLATASVANLWLAGAHAPAGDDVAMNDAIDAALARDPSDPRILGDLYGRVLVTRAFVRDELDDLVGLTETMMEHVRRAPPTQSVYPGRLIWALLRTAHADDGGQAARDEFAEVVRNFEFPMFVLGSRLIDAVALGRGGERSAADAMSAHAYRMLADSPLSRGVFHTMMVVAAQAAIRDRWGEPVVWLRDAEAFFTERRYGALARRCRALLGDAGAPVPRRRGQTTVPEALRALGVTGREVDVLKLVVAGNSNKQIAAELVLSPKTVERHLSNLFSRFGVGDRHSLAEVGRGHLA